MWEGGTRMRELVVGSGEGGGIEFVNFPFLVFFY